MIGFLFFALPAAFIVVYVFAMVRKARKPDYSAYKSAVRLALVAAFLLFWVNGAVGTIGSEDEDINLLYSGVYAVGIIGALIARFHPRGMARALFATALAQALVPMIALIVQATSWGAAGVSGVFVLNAFFVMLFAGSALLFRKAAREQTSAGVVPEDWPTRRQSLGSGASSSVSICALCGSAFSELRLDRSSRLR